MSKKNKYTGFAIAIAWPETYCKQAGAWYDGITDFLGFSKNNYYKVGHSALVLIKNDSNKCQYFDFGRYHAPLGFGRVRSAKTDHGLKINTLSAISDDGKVIENFKDILTELQLNNECHGEGMLYASYCNINYEKTLDKILQMQLNSPIAYGPFKYNGSNCSRFVNDSIKAGNPNWKSVFRLNFFVPLTPTPLNNVNSLKNKIVLPKMLAYKAFCPNKVTDKSILKNTLQQPSKNAKIPETAQWLSGEGAGSWFNLDILGSHYFITRYNPVGEIECVGKFKENKKNTFDKNLDYKFVHLSHCQKVTIQQNNKTIEFTRVANKKVSKIKIQKHIEPIYISNNKIKVFLS